MWLRKQFKNERFRTYIILGFSFFLLGASLDYDIKLSTLMQKQQLHEIINMLQPRLDKGDSLSSFQVFFLTLSYTGIRNHGKALAQPTAVATGDDVVGFTLGFLYAGARSLVSSLWQVDDQATRDLMVNFYTNLSKMSKDEALRRAQLSVKKQYPHPFYWAAFLLIGNAI